jgi:DUF1365 family protein
MTLRSALYVGSVMHRRLRPHAHHFRYRAFWLLIDLDELPGLSKGLWLLSHNKFNLFSLHDADHGDGTSTPLRVQVERELGGAGLELGGGRISLLAMPRTLGCGFNPLSIYFCHRADGTLAALVYQVHNTFGERHSYVIPVQQVSSRSVHQRCRKDFHVSPFLDMNLIYEFRVTGPNDRLAVGIRASTPSGPLLTAVLTGTRKALTDRALMRVGLAVPAVTAKVTAAIHWEALRLWLKGMRYRRKPAAPADMISVASINARTFD